MKDNIATQHFKGDNEANLDLRQFSSWYDLDTVKYLAHLPDILQEQYRSVKYVFYDDAWDVQLDHLSVLKNSLDTKILFISKEPGANSNHFIFGMLIDSSLLIVDPIGITSNKGFYDKLVELNKKRLFSSIYISNTLIQRDPEDLVSCGPIAVELLNHFASFSDEEIAKIFFSGKQVNKYQVEFTEISLEKVLPKSLHTLLNSAEDYKNLIINIRSEHLSILEFTESKLQANLEEQNEFLDKCLNSPDQKIMFKLYLEEKQIEELSYEIAVILYNLGRFGNLTIAKKIKYYSDALEALNNPADLKEVKILRVKLLNNLGSVYGEIGKNEKRIEYYEKALKEIDVIDYSEKEILKVKILNNLGVAYSKLQQHDRQLNLYLEALEITLKSQSMNTEMILSKICGDCEKIDDKYVKINFYKEILKVICDADDLVAKKYKVQLLKFNFKFRI